MQRFMQKTATIFLLVLSILTPLKFSSLVLSSYPPLFHNSLFGWLLGTWPNDIFFVAAAIGCALSITAFPRLNLKSAGGKFVLLFMGLTTSAFLGLFNAGQYAYAITQLTYLASLSCYLLSLQLYLANNEANRKKVIYAWGIGIAIALLVAVHQYFYGFEDMLEYIREQRESGNAVSAVLEAKIADKRTNLPFDLPNSLAGFLLIALPVLGIMVWDFCEKFDPPKLTRAIFMPLSIIVVIFVFATTRSRAAMMAATGAMTVLAIISLKSKWLKSVLIVAITAAIAIGAVYVKNSGRGLESFNSRIEYAKVAGEMIVKHPLAGAGWGNFYFDYMKNRGEGSEESPHAPHNLVLAFGSQAGLAAMVLALAMMAMPFIYILIKKRYDKATIFLAAGLLGFLLHSLADVNLQVPSSMALMLTVSLLIFNSGESTQPSSKIRFSRLFSAILPLIISAFAIFLTVGDYKFYQLSEAGRYSPQKIVTMSRDAESLQPWNFNIPRLAAGVLMNKNAPYESQEQLNKAFTLSPENSDLWQLQMELAFRRGDRRGAELALTKAREYFPGNWLLKGTVPEVIENLKKSRSMR